MDVDQIRLDALRVLEDTRAKLNSWQFLLELRNESDDVKQQTATTMLDIALARQVLIGAILSDISDELKKEEEELTRAIENLDNRLSDLKKIQPILDAINNFLDIIAKVVTLFP